MRAILLLVVLGCSSGKQAPQVVGHAVCVDATDTVDLDSQRPEADAIAGCKTWPRFELVEKVVSGMCGPCGFTLDRAVTLEQRKRSETACCYAVSSPPPPPPPPRP